MPGGRGLFSPIGQSAISRLPGTPQEYVSPSMRKPVNHVPSPALAGGVSTLLVTPSVNDDVAERKARRRSKVLELQRHTLASPATPANDRRRSLPLNGLSNAQVSEHYSNCIKLSAENKINAKNAFGLHLIDYMSELLKKKEMNNFQVASSTLDASAKIYAGRVDAIHSETYKVLSGLGRGTDKQGDKECEGAAEGEGDDQTEEKEHKRKRARKSNTIETNLKNLNVNKFDLEFEDEVSWRPQRILFKYGHTVDPLFSKTSAAFDEGGTGGLLVNHLRCLDDTSELILDSNTVITNMDELPPTDSQEARGKKLVDLTEFKSMYAGLDLASMQICPAFAEFEFNNWNREGESQFSFLSKSTTGAGDAPGRSEHAFDLDAEVEPIPDTTLSGAISDAGDDQQTVGGGFMDEFDHMDDEADNDMGSDLEKRDFCLGDGKEAQMLHTAMDKIKHGTVGDLMQILASEPSDYSYFNSKLLRTWAGPQHWKLQAKAKDAASAADLAAGDKLKKSKEKKDAYVIDYKEEVDFDASFKESRASTTLTKATLDKYSNTQTTLPEDLHYDADQLFKLFANPKLMIKRHASSKNVDDGVQDYDYDNENDRQNFCPDVDDGADEDDQEEGGFNFTAGSNDPFSQDATIQGSFNDTALNGTILTGDKLVDQPRKVTKLDINYAKAAKRMDVRKLKASMWSILVKHEVEAKSENPSDSASADVVEDNPAASSSAGEVTDETSVAGKHSFLTMVTELPDKISQNMCKNLSVPIAFVCLLHLANEKTLKITSDESMADLCIVQG